MSVFVHYCDRCGIRIKPENIEWKRALVLGDKAYCAECVRLLRAEGELPEEPAVHQPHKPHARSHRPKKKSTTTIARHPRREKTGEHDAISYLPGRAARKSPLGLVLIVCVIIAVLVILVVATTRRNTSPARKRGYKKPSRATTERPDKQPPEADPVPQREHAPSPRMLSAMRKYDQALEYGKNYPKDYAGVIKKLDAISDGGTVNSLLEDKIRETSSEWWDLWEAEARAEWDETKKAADELTAKEDHEAAAKLWDSFSEKYKGFATFAEKGLSEAKRLRTLKEALAALESAKEDIAAATKKFTVAELEEAKKLHDKLLNLGRKYRTIKEVVEVLTPALKSLEMTIDRLREKAFEEAVRGPNRK